MKPELIDILRMRWLRLRIYRYRGSFPVAYRILRNYVRICQRRFKTDPLTTATDGLILTHHSYSGLASVITPAFLFCFNR